MAPTIQNGASGSDKRPQRQQEKKSELICRVKYSNNLPDIPFDLKFITYPFENDRFIQYNPTSLERNYKYDVLTEHDLGVTIDLINRDLYQADPYGQLDPADEKLLEEDVHTPQDSMRSRQHAKSVSWLRKSEYISTEQTRFQPQNIEKVEAQVGYNVKKSLREETLYMDRNTQIKAIEKTFHDSKTPITKHYSKPNVTAVEVFPLFPDFKNWKYPCAQVIFDSDPAPVGKNVPAQLEEMSQAMIRGVMDESGEQFVAYFLPTEPTLEKRRKDFASEVLYEDEEEYEYKMAREYNWNVKSKASKGYEENYFFIVRSDGVYYNELETRVRLSKRRQKIGQAPNNTKLVVKHRPLNASEHRMQRYRERQLEPHAEDEDEEMEEPEPEPVEETKPTEETKRKSRSRTRSKSSESEGRGKRDGSENSSPERRSRRNSSGSDRSGSRASSKGSASSRSRSRSGTRSKSSGSESGHQSDRSKASSRRSRTKSGSRSRSASRSRSRSGSGERQSRSRTRSKSGSRSRSGSGSGGSRSGSGSRSRSASASGSERKSGSNQGSGSDSG